jgi:hypothetical protein
VKFAILCDDDEGMTCFFDDASKIACEVNNYLSITHLNDESCWEYLKQQNGRMVLVPWWYYENLGFKWAT